MRSIFLNRTAAGLAVVLASAVGLASCASEFTRTGDSPAYLVVDSITAASGANPADFGTPLFSDVVTNVQTQVHGQRVLVPTFFADLGRAQTHAAMKNRTSVTGPTNAITIN